MKKLFTLTLALILSVATIKAQIAITPDTNTVQLVNDFILFGVSASNVNFTGAASALGSFTNGITTNIGLSDGIIMSTGTVDSSQGVYICSPVTEFATVANNTAGNPLLNNLIPGYNTYDAAVLEFDLVPAGNVLEFTYVFASEEYPEYVGSSFNDVFGFFITGPDPQGGQYNNLNIALIPNSTLPVAINNVHAGLNPAYFIDNLTLNGQTIVFDGFTTPLQAIVSVVPQGNYHLTMAVADAGDAAFDSGIFLKAQSMKSYLVMGTNNPQAPHTSIYPNPASNHITVTHPSGRSEIAICNVFGQVVLQQTVENQHTPISVEHLKNGVYFLYVTGGDATECVRFMKN